MPSSFTLHEIVSGVWAAIAPGMAGPAVSNAAIVDLGDKTLVVDTFMTTRAAGELADEAKRLTGRDRFLVVNSHWHSDHVRGNPVFAGSPIIGTERMRELIIEDAPETPEEHAQRVESMQSAARSLIDADTQEERDHAAGVQSLADALAEETYAKSITLPDLLIGDRLDIAGERRATVLGYGRGHTESDLFVHLPDDDVVIAGDLVWNGIHPKTSDGFPAQWVGVIDRMAALDPRHVVPGHGEPGAGSQISIMADYMRAIDATVDAVRAGDLTLEDAAPPTLAASWQEPDRFEAGMSALAERAKPI